MCIYPDSFQKDDTDALVYKGDRYLSRRRKGENNIFAPTPPLEVVRTILMLAVAPSLWAPSWVALDGPHRMQVSFVDISRA